MDEKDFIYEDFNNLNDIKLLSDNININKTDTFECGKFLDKSETYYEWTFIESEVSKVNNIVYFFEHLYNNNIIKPHKNKYYCESQNITLIADEPNFCVNSIILNDEQYKKEVEAQKSVYDDEYLFTETVDSLYNILINYSDETLLKQGYSAGYLFHTSCILNQYWQINDNDEEEVFYILNYTVNQPSMNLATEYPGSVEFHNKVACELCKRISKEYNIKCYPSYIKYHIDLAFIETKYI